MIEALKTNAILTTILSNTRWKMTENQVNQGLFNGVALPFRVDQDGTLIINLEGQVLQGPTGPQGPQGDPGVTGEISISGLSTNVLELELTDGGGTFYDLTAGQAYAIAFWFVAKGTAGTFNGSVASFEGRNVLVNAQSGFVLEPGSTISINDPDTTGWTLELEIRTVPDRLAFLFKQAVADSTVEIAGIVKPVET